MAIEQNSLPDERTILKRRKRLIGRASRTVTQPQATKNE